ncbi:Protein ccc1 [Exophiala xenobiotica]|nr:Protein ccc1 [Exophiala xenobiotica]
MGLGAYLATITDKQHYDTERVREKKELQECPDEETEEIYQILCAYGPGRGHVAPFVDELKKDPEQWIQFMMDFELKLQRPVRGGAYMSSATMGIAPPSNAEGLDRPSENEDQLDDLHDDFDEPSRVEAADPFADFDPTAVQVAPDFDTLNKAIKVKKRKRAKGEDKAPKKKKV